MCTWILKELHFNQLRVIFFFLLLKKTYHILIFFFRTAFSFLLDFLITVDLLAHVFDVLRNDLKSDIAKELFLYYQATPVVLQYLKPVNKVISSTTSNYVIKLCLKGDNSSKKRPFYSFIDRPSWDQQWTYSFRCPQTHHFSNRFWRHAVQRHGSEQ